MDKNKVLPVFIGAYDKFSIAVYQRDADFAVLEQVAQAVGKIDRFRDYNYRRVCTGCWGDRAHETDCPWLKLEALGIVEKA